MPACRDCGRDNPDGFAFCGHCAAPLDRTSATAVEERRVVTVLFCDVVGFTSSSERADPEDVRARMQPYYARLRSEIEGFGGTVEKFIGDAVMAVFGVPLAHEDDAERAVRAGLRILEAIEELNTQDPALDLSVRVGVNTGEVVVSLGASLEAGEAAVLGDAVNTAARIQTAAPVSAVAVGEMTYSATERVFDYEPLEPVVAKGKVEPVPIWRAVAARARFGAEMRSHDNPLVGRDVERTLLRSLFERAVRDRSVQLVTIIGEPGVGKSRLVWELETFVDEYPDLVAWRQGRCLPYGDGIAFWGLGEIVKADAGILESDAADVAAGKLARAVSPAEPDRDWLFARVGTLVGIDAAVTSEQDEMFTAWRRYLEGIADARPAVFVFEDLHWADAALLDFLGHVAEWSEGVAMILVCTARPELLERHPDWAGGTRNATTINLAPLTPTETAELIGALLDRSLLPAEVQQPIVERSGGNPLYAEEYVRMLRDRGLLQQRGASWTLLPDAELPLPESVQALVAARLDTLAPQRKLVLQDAAVLGKVFWTGGVAEMSGVSEGDVNEAFREFSRRDLVRSSRTTTMEGEAEHFFTHIVIRDVAYAQIPRAARSKKHRAAAEWIEAKAGERIEDLADVLAYHTTEALELADSAGLAAEAVGLREQARRFLLLAADRAMRLDVGSALVLYRRALAVTPPDHVERPVILERLSRAATESASYDEAVGAFDEAAVLYETRGDMSALGRLLANGSHVLQHRGQAGTREAGQRAIEILEQEPPGPALVDAYGSMGSIEWVSGNDSAAIEWTDRAIALGLGLGIVTPRFLAIRGAARAGLGDRAGIDDIRRALPLFDDTQTRHHAQALNNLALALLPFDGPAPALEICREALELGRRRGVVELERTAAATAIELLYPLGRWDEAVAQAEVVGGDTADWERLFCEWVIRDILVARGHLAQAARGLSGLIATARRFDETQLLVPPLATAAHIASRRGERHEAVRFLRELHELPGVCASWNLPTYLASITRTALRAGAPETASALLDGFPTTTRYHEHARVASQATFEEADRQLGAAIELYTEAARSWRGFGYVPETAFAEMGRGRCLLALGRVDEAAEPLAAAREIFASLRAALYLEEVDALLAELKPSASSSSGSAL